MNTTIREAWSPSAVFSPSQARQQLLQANDWSYVEEWLQMHFHPKPVPEFERTPEVLKALLTLAQANENANEQKELERRLRQKALSELKKRDAVVSNIATPISSLQDHLTTLGATSLGSIALLSVALGTNSVSPQKLSKELVGLSKEEFDLKEQTLRIEALHQKLKVDLEHMRNALADLHGDTWKVPPELGTKAMEWSHSIRHLEQKSAEYKARVAQLEAAYNNSNAPHLSISHLIEQEKAILELKEHVLNLESQVKGFQGLPPEKDLARLEVERVESLLRELEVKRESLYDGMIGS